MANLYVTKWEEIKAMIPHIEESIYTGGFHIDSVTGDIVIHARVRVESGKVIFPPKKKSGPKVVKK